MTCDTLAEILDSGASIERLLTEMEVVVVAISEEHECPNNVDNGFRTKQLLATIKQFPSPYGGKSPSEPLTHGRCVLPKVTGFVSP